MFLKLDRLPIPIDFEEIFGRNAPVEIEIGVGKGRFLREKASALPNHNFLGIEKSKKWLAHAAERLRKAQLTNIRLLQSYAEGFLDRYIPDQSVSAYHILFPDPWPKRRHHKRRIFNVKFLLELFRTLTPEGRIYIATDYQSYFEEIRTQFQSFEPQGIQFEQRDAGPFLSNFQVKYAKEGRSLYFAQAYTRYFFSDSRI